jgi:hypothetical protein
MALTVISGPIMQPGESLSEGVDCSGGNAVRITMPAAWTPANLTFAISTDGGGYNDLFDAEGKEVTMVVVPGSAVHIAAEWATFWNFIKFRSGTRSHPVKQETQRDFAITLMTPDAPATGGASQQQQRPATPARPTQPPQRG